jgi:hypothetical protein
MLLCGLSIPPPAVRLTIRRRKGPEFTPEARAQEERLRAQLAAKK